MPIKGQSPKQVVHTEMHKWKHGSLHSGSKRGPLVKNRKQAIAIALSESKKARKKYADGGATTADDMVNEAQQQLATQKDRMPEPSPGGDTVDWSKYNQPRGEMKSGTPAWEHYQQTGKLEYPPEDIEKGVNIGMAAGPGIMVGPYGAHMLRGATHPIYGEEMGQAASRLRPEFRDAYKGWQGEARDAQARSTLEMRQASENPYDLDVWKGAGWHRGAEGAPKKEIPDIGAKLVPTEGGYRLEHPAGDLHKIYDIPPIQIDKRLGKTNAQINHDTGQITLGSPNVSAALHEIQHAIQRKEGFSGGSNPHIASGSPAKSQEFFPNGYGSGSAEVPSWHGDLVAKQVKRGVDPEEVGAAHNRAVFRAYERSAGETEARNVQDRRAKSFRYQAHPEDTEDITRGLQWESRNHAPRPRADIKIHETSNPSEIVPKGEHKIYNPSDYGFASGGSVGGFNPERGAAFGLAKQGMLHSNVPGRTDKLNLDVPSGSSIVPADVVSALGQGNSLAGNSVLTNMFSKGPYGMNIGKAKGGMRTHQRAASLSKMRFAAGGETKTAPIVAAGGEFVVHPETVAHLGNGDLDLGHSILNSFYEQVRENNIKTLRKLPGPKNIK